MTDHRRTSSGAGTTHVPLPDGDTLPVASERRAAECGCRLSGVRRDLERALRALADAELRLPLDEELTRAPLSAVEAERIDRYCLNLKVSIDELQRWTRLLTGAAEAVAARSRPAGGRGDA